MRCSHALQVAAAVAGRVLEGARIDLIDDAAAPPVRIASRLAHRIPFSSADRFLDRQRDRAAGNRPSASSRLLFPGQEQPPPEFIAQRQGEGNPSTVAIDHDRKATALGFPFASTIERRRRSGSVHCSVLSGWPVSSSHATSGDAVRLLRRSGTPFPPTRAQPCGSRQAQTHIPPAPGRGPPSRARSARCPAHRRCCCPSACGRTRLRPSA